MPNEKMESFLQNKTNKNIVVNATKKYYIYNFKTTSLQLVSKKHFLSLSGCVFKVNDTVTIKMLHVSRNEAKNKHLFGKFKQAFLGESTFQDVISTSKNVFQGLGIAVKVLQVLGDSIQTAHMQDLPQGGNTMVYDKRSVLSIILSLTSLLLKWQRIVDTPKDIKFFIEIILDIALVYNNMYGFIGNSNFRAESLDALLLTGASFYLPEKFLNFVKRFNLLTSIKILDDHQLFLEFYGHLVDAIHFLLDKAPLSDEYKVSIKDTLNCLRIGQHYILLYRAEKVLADINKDKTLIRQIVFRKAVFSLHKDIDANPMLKEIKRRSESVSAILQQFRSLVLQIKSYDESSRVEPICIVFEGKPGCGKSVFMNQIVEVLDRPTYCHSIKSVMDGKDWYDSYNNEDIFTMDDVGQQGISQWRTIINMVSAVKLPLECAEVGLKRSKFFNSEILLLTTNMFENLNGLTKNDCISDIHALWRRGYIFDFSHVKFVDGQHKGICQFKYYDIESRCFLSSFPKFLKDFLEKKNINLSDSFYIGVDQDNEASSLLEWASIIITSLNEIQKNRYKESSLSSSFKNDVRTKLSQISNLYQDRFYDAESYEDKLSIFKWVGSVFFSEILGNMVTNLLGLHDLIHPYLEGKNLAMQVVCHKTLQVLVGWATTLCISYIFNFIKSWIVDKRSYSAETGVESLLKELSGQQVEVDLRIPKIQKNMMCVVTYQNDMQVKSFALFSGRHVVIPSHGLPLDEGVLDASVQEDFANKVLDKIPFKVVYRNVKDDLCILSLPKHFARPFKSMHNYVANEKDPGVVWLLTPQNRIYLSSHIRKNCRDTVYTYGKHYLNYINKEDIRYDFRATGLCGAILFDENIGIKGFHVAGSASEGLGVAKIWSDETVNKLKELLFFQNGFEIIETDVPSGSKLRDTGISVYLDQKSNIGPSHIHGVFPITRIPSDLKKFGPFTIKDVGKKSFNSIVKVNDEELNFAKEVIHLLIPTFGDISEKEIVSGNDNLCGLNKKSSNGYGLEKDKLLYIDFKNDSLTPHCKNLLKELEDRILNQTTTLDDRVWIECLKDELRNEEKDRVPRSFRICSLLNQILLKETTGEMVSKLIEMKYFTQIMVGVNPFTEWPVIYNKLLTYEHKWAGDIGSFDGNMLSEVQDMVCSIILHKYRGNKREQLAWLLENLVRSVVVMKDDILVTTHSMPSGCFLTAILNSLINRAYTAMWYYRNLKSKNIIPKVNDFIIEVCDFVYGDDKLNGVNKHFDVLNAVSMRLFFESIGMKFTTADKLPVTDLEEKLCDISFLKRKFVYHSKLQCVVAPLDVRTLYSSLSWIDWSKDQEAVLQDKINWFQREIYLHEELYEQDIFKLIEKCTKEGIPIVKLPEYYLQQLYLSNPEDYYTYGYISTTGNKY